MTSELEVPLDSRLTQLLKNAKDRRIERCRSRDVEMEGIGRRTLHFQDVSRKALQETVLPRFGPLLRLFHNASAPSVRDAPVSVSIGFKSVPEYPVGAEISLYLLHDFDIRNLVATWKVSIIPILIDYEQQATYMTGLEAPDLSSSR